MSRSAVARLEQGRGDKLTIATLETVAAALDARFVWRIDWHGEALDRLVDEAHALLVEQVVGRLTASGWRCATEVSFNVYGERGSVDVLGYHPGTRSLVVVEVKTAIGDNQATLMTLDRKVRLAPRIAGARGWDPRMVARVLVLPDASTPRRRVERLAATYAAALPDRGRDVVRWLRRPGPTPLAGVWFLSVERQATTRCRAERRSPRPPLAAPVKRPLQVQVREHPVPRDRVRSD